LFFLTKKKKKKTAPVGGRFDLSLKGLF